MEVQSAKCNTSDWRAGAGVPEASGSKKGCSMLTCILSRRCDLSCPLTYSLPSAPPSIKCSVLGISLFIVVLPQGRWTCLPLTVALTSRLHATSISADPHSIVRAHCGVFAASSPLYHHKNIVIRPLAITARIEKPHEAQTRMPKY